MRTLILIATLTLVAFGLAASARAGDCQTTCYNDGMGHRVCNTHCW